MDILCLWWHSSNSLLTVDEQAPYIFEQLPVFALTDKELEYVDSHEED